MLFEERDIYSASLRDPVRIVAQPLHPYLLPLAELPYALARGRFSYQVLHVPYVLVVLGFVGLAVSCARRMSCQWRRQGVAVALLLLPCIPTGFSMLSAREPFMGVFALAAVYCLSRWEEDPRREFLLSGAFFALVMQQTKIEGLPFLCGWVVGVLVLCVRRDDRRGARLAQLPWVGLVLACAVPWMIVRQGIPRAHIDPFMADYRSVMSFRSGSLLASVRLLVSELFLRPELYAFTPWVVVAAILSGWRKGAVSARIAVLLAPVVCMLAVLMIYALRQEQLGSERNVSISRRVVCFLPGLTLAAFYLPRANGSRDSATRETA